MSTAPLGKQKRTRTSKPKKCVGNMNSVVFVRIDIETLITIKKNIKFLSDNLSNGLIESKLLG